RCGRGYGRAGAVGPPASLHARGCGRRGRSCNPSGSLRAARSRASRSLGGATRGDPLDACRGDRCMTMHAKFERLYPWLFGVLTTGAYLVWLRERPLPAATKDLFNAALNIGGIAIAFLITAKAILISVEDRRAVRAQKTGGTWPTLIGYMLRAI